MPISKIFKPKGEFLISNFLLQEPEDHESDVSTAT